MVTSNWDEEEYSEEAHDDENYYEDLYKVFANHLDDEEPEEGEENEEDESLMAKFEESSKKR